MLSEIKQREIADKAAEISDVLSGKYTAAKSAYDALLEKTAVDYAYEVPELLSDNAALRARLAEVAPIIAAVASAYVRSPQYSNPVLEFPTELETTEQPFAYHLRDLAEKWRADAEHAAQPSGDGGGAV